MFIMYMYIVIILCILIFSMHRVVTCDMICPHASMYCTVHPQGNEYTQITCVHLVSPNEKTCHSKGCKYSNLRKIVQCTVTTAYLKLAILLCVIMVINQYVLLFTVNTDAIIFI